MIVLTVAPPVTAVEKIAFNSQPVVLRLDPTPLQSATPGQTPAQSKQSSEALAEATKISLSVVKLFDAGRYDEALPLAKRALALREAAVGADDEVVQGSLLNLAEIYLALKKYGDARKILERLLKTNEREFGSEDAGAAILLDKFALTAFAEGDFKETEVAYKRALAIREKVFGPESREFAASLSSLGEFYRLRNRPADAKPLFERAALLQEKLFGRDNAEYSRTRDRYFCLIYENVDKDRDRLLNDVRERLGDASQASIGSTVDLGFLNGRALSLPRPVYPVEARRVRAQGTVVLKVTIDESGNVVEATDMCGGNPFLVRPAISAARAARFSPTELSGKTVRAKGVITYHFVVR